MVGGYRDAKGQIGFLCEFDAISTEIPSEHHRQYRQDGRLDKGTQGEEQANIRHLHEVV